MNLKRSIATLSLAAAVTAGMIGAGSGVAIAEPGGCGPHACGGPPSAGPPPPQGGPGREWPGQGPPPPEHPGGFHDAPWGWGPPPRAGWRGPLPPPGGVWNAGPVNYWGYNVQPVWNPGFAQWGFWLFGVWIQL
ncbi:hypothetical protein [Mycobacterium sp. MS1601]|uniref:hypothetical protein n=1 Tax=Mycobacterium sp. MS1601 TaxID=1936029 RepID=UPI0009FA5C18|nr:hypothetical protein [Mycobacterium sp. MS1601]